MAPSVRSLLPTAIVAALTLATILASIKTWLLEQKAANNREAVCMTPAEPELTFSSSGSCDIVAAEFEAAANLAALVRVLPDCRLFVYSKSQSCDVIRQDADLRGAALLCEDLDNVGRESHTWIHHVLTHYTDLADRVYFVPLPLSDAERMRSLKRILGRPVRKGKRTKSLHVLAAPSNSSSPASSTEGQFACVRSRYTGCYAWKPRRDAATIGGNVRGYDIARVSMGRYETTTAMVTRGVTNHTPACLAAPSREHQRGFGSDCDDCSCFAHRVCGPGGFPSPARTSPLGPWVEAVFGAAAASIQCHVPICNSGLFAATRTALQGQSLTMYKTVLGELNTSHHPEAGYYVERLLPLLFTPQTFSTATPCKPQGARGARCSTVRWESPIMISRGRGFRDLDRLTAPRRAAE